MDKLTQQDLFFLEHFSASRVSNALRIADYFFLYAIRNYAGRRGQPGRTYLADLSQELSMPIPALSRTVELLQEQGYLIWEMDAEAGQTYVELSGKARKFMDSERARMRDCYERIVQQVEPQALEQTIATLKQVRQILTDSAEDGDGAARAIPSPEAATPGTA